MQIFARVAVIVLLSLCVAAFAAAEGLRLGVVRERNAAIKAKCGRYVLIDEATGNVRFEYGKICRCNEGCECPCDRPGENANGPRRHRCDD